MRLVLQHANVRSTDDLDLWIENSLCSLRPLLRIDEARIRIEYRGEKSPPYHASAHLVIPGPDVRVEAVDHTPRNVVAKLLTLLRERAAERAARRLRRELAPARVRSFLRIGRSSR